MLKTLSYSKCSILLQYLFVISLVVISPISSALADDTVADPIEGFNRGVFWVNNQVDEYVLEPVAIGYDYITPQPVKNSVRNFFSNLAFPIRLVSDVLQLKFTQAGDHTARFLINSTIGVAGLFDPATDYGFEHHGEDLGTAFGNWGIGPGFYLVLPILGPSNLRDAVGLAGESFLYPTVAVAYSDMAQRDKNLIMATSNTLDIVSRRAELLKPVEAAKEASLDYYSFVKHAYHQRREALINDTSSEDALFDDEFDEEFDEEAFEENEDIDQ